MTQNDKLNTLLCELGEVLNSKNETISLRDYQLKEARKEIATLKKMNDALEKENAMLEDALKDAECEINNLKGVEPYVD